MKKFMKKVLMVSVVATLGLNLVAQEEGEVKEKPKKEMPVLVDVSVSGVVTKKEVKGVAKYSLTLADGSSVALPAKKGTEEIDYASLEGKTVTVKGKGYEKAKKAKDGSESKAITVKTIESIDAEGNAEGTEEKME